MDGLEGESPTPTQLPDSDQDGYAPAQGDCDDSDSAVHPDATEVCDAKDNDCNQSIDDGPEQTGFEDLDGDGYGTQEISITYCNHTTPLSELDGDCDDADAAIHPGASEVCDKEDNNCDGTVDEGVLTVWYKDGDRDTFGDNSITTQACDSPPVGFVDNGLDCNDGQSAINPNAEEVCDAVDNNCSGEVDEDVQIAFYPDVDKDTQGDANATAHMACSAGSGSVSNNLDCNDRDDDVYSGAEERCDQKDNDCDLLVDEGFSTVES